MLITVSHDELQQALLEVDQAFFNHERWSESVYATLICRLVPDERDINSDAHRHCRFGQWYYNCSSAVLTQHAGFSQIAKEHKHMHESASSLLFASHNNLPITVQEYEHFSNSLKQLRLDLLVLKQSLTDALYNIDPLTNVCNRTGMLKTFHEQQAMVRRGVHNCCIAMMDLDHFKNVNDTYGHPVGDAVLSGMAQYVLAHLRPYDKVFRYGGEEFLFCLTDTDQTTGLQILDRLREELALQPYRNNEQQEFHLTVSFGLTLLDPDATVEEAIERADKALYVAKSSGRNRAVLWNASMNQVPEELTA